MDGEYRGSDFTAAVTLGNPDVLVGSGKMGQRGRHPPVCQGLGAGILSYWGIGGSTHPAVLGDHLSWMESMTQTTCRTAPWVQPTQTPTGLSLGPSNCPIVSLVSLETSGLL